MTINQILRRMLSTMNYGICMMLVPSMLWY
jgi:hypothetical protein